MSSAPLYLTLLELLCPRWEDRINELRQKIHGKIGLWIFKFAHPAQVGIVRSRVCRQDRKSSKILLRLLLACPFDGRRSRARRRS